MRSGENAWGKGYTSRVLSHPSVKKPVALPKPILSAHARTNKFRQWKKQFKVIKNAVFDIALRRFVYRQVTKLVQDNPRLQVPSAFYDWMHAAYITDMTVSIRRLVDWDKRTVSLIKLIEDIEKHPEVMSRRRFTHSYKNFMKECGHSDFDRWAEPGGDVINRKLISKHRSTLIKSQKRLRTYLNNHIAHLNKRGLRKFPTYADLDACLDVLENLTTEYALLLEQVALDPVIPVIQYDWMAPFRVAWLQDKQTY